MEFKGFELGTELNNSNKDITYCENCGVQNTMIINLLGVDRIVPCLCSCRKAKLEQEKLEEQKKS